LTAQGGDTGARHIDSWVTFRPELKILDCTIRDGGLMNDHRFEHSFVQRIYETGVAAGSDYMEHGYQATLVEEIAQFFQRGEIYRQKKPVYWCINCRTASCTTSSAHSHNCRA